MEHLIIKKVNGGERIRLFGSSSSPVKVSKAEQKKELLGANIVSVSFESVDPVSFEIGDYLDVFGERYWINLLPKAKKTRSDRFSYDIEFESIQYDLSKILFLDEDKSGKSTSSSFVLRANLEQIAGIVINNMARVYGAGVWTLGTLPNQTTEIRDFTFDDQNCLAVLQTVCEDYGLEFNVVPSSGGATINFGKLGAVIPYVLKYGRGNGLYNINRQNVSSSNIITRLYAYGSSKNLPSNYRNYSSKLRLPDSDGQNRSYIEKDDAVAAFGVIEGSKTWDEIYPHYTGSVSGIVADDVLSFVDSSIDFDLNEKNADGSTKYLIAGTSAKITFNSGGLSGYTFEVSSHDYETKTFTLLKYEDPRGNVFPSDTISTFQISAGDSYVITDVYPRQSDITKAEGELLSVSTDYLNQNCAPRVQYEVKIAEDYLNKLSGSTDGSINLFNVGDAIGIVDEDVNISRTGEEAIRITSFTRNIIAKTPYDYTFTISDTLEIKLIERVISDQKDVDTIIKINNLTDVSKLQRSWRTTQEVLSMIFDQEGYFKDGNIRPNSIETQMLSVGAKAQQFTLKDVVVEPNYQGSYNSVRVVGGSLIHYGLFDEPKTWQITTTNYNLTGSEAKYIWARCDKVGSTCLFVFDTTQHKVEEGTYYYFLLGVLNSVDTKTSTRWISLTYGATAINGRFIKTGRIVSADGSTWFDLDSGEIHGKITFGSDNKTIEEVDEKADSAVDYINNTLPGVLDQINDKLDGVVESYFGEVVPSLSNAPANEWTTSTLKESHLGDLYYNNTTGIGYRWSKSGTTYQWVEVRDSGITEALAAAQKAQDTADGKRRVFTGTPYPPYDTGDLWTNGSDLKRCIKSRASGNYVASDWDLATNYTGDESLNTFINGVFKTTVEDLGTKIDGKIETWFQSSNPWYSWSSGTESRHLGDMWYNTSTKELKRYAGSDNSNTWDDIVEAKAIAAYEAASQAQDTADGKRTVFVNQPYTPYQVGDLWTNGSDLKRCIKSRASGNYVASDWDLATEYDSTKTTINGGIVTSGTIQLAGSGGSILAGITGQGTSSSSVRIWAGATFDNRASAPFRVTQNGEVFARYRIELQDSSLNGLAGICGQGTDGSDNSVRFWAGSSYADRASAPFRVLKNGAVVMEKSTIKNGCTIGSWEVSNGGIFNDSGEAYIIARKAYGDGNYTEARIGTSVFPASTGLIGCTYFENSMSNSYGKNLGVYISVRNALHNIAIWAKGDVVVGGFCGSYESYTTTLTANTVTILPFKYGTYLIKCYVSAAGVGLPSRYDVADSLGISYSTSFSVKITIIATTSVSTNYKVYGRNTSLKNSSNVYFMDYTYYPYWLNANGATQNGGWEMGKGDNVSFQLVYDGYNYYAYFLNYEN